MALGADFSGGVGGVLVLILVAALLGAAFASLSNGVGVLARQREIADRRGEPRPAAADLPVLGADAAEPRARLDPTVSTVNPVNWAVEAGRSAAMESIDWGVVGTRVGLLVALVVGCATFATRALRHLSALTVVQVRRRTAANARRTGALTAPV